MMGDDLKINTVRSYNSTVTLRTLNAARDQHWIVDSSYGPGEAPNAIEVFLSGISACAVQHVELIAKEQNVPLRSVVCTIRSVRKVTTNHRFESITLHFELEGPSEEQAKVLAAAHETRCPLYGAVAVATRVNVEIKTRP